MSTANQPAANEPSAPAGGRTGDQPAGNQRRSLPYADLVWTLIRTDFKSRYHGTLSGFVWALLKPLAMFVTLLAIFSFVFSTEPNYRTNLLIGLFLWDFFAESTKVGVIALAQKSFLLTKAKFPAWIVVVTSISNPLITLAVFAVSIVILLAATDRAPSAAGILLFALILVAFVLLVVGISLATSVLFLRYRDLNQVWDVVIQAGFFLTPIIWPIGAIPERYHYLFYLWPPTPFVDFARQVLVNSTAPSGKALAYLVAETAIVLVVGSALFRRLSPRAAEYL